MHSRPSCLVIYIFKSPATLEVFTFLTASCFCLHLYAAIDVPSYSLRFSAHVWTNISVCDIFQKRVFYEVVQHKTQKCIAFHVFVGKTNRTLWYWTLLSFAGFFSTVSRLQFSVKCSCYNFPRVFLDLCSDGTELSLLLAWAMPTRSLISPLTLWRNSCISVASLELVFCTWKTK